MPITTQLQTQIEAVQARIDALAPTATAEDIVMMAKAVEAVGGQATVFDVIETGETKKAEVVALADAKKAELVTTGDTQANRVVAQGDLKLDELSQELQQYAAFGGADGSSPGTLGMVPAPQAGDEDKYLRASGEWKKPGEIPIGSIALIHPNMDTTGFLPAKGGTALIADYPELFDVLGSTPSTIPTYDSGTSVFSGSESLGYSNHRAFAINGNRVVVVRSGSKGIEYSNNGGQSWANAQIGSISNPPYWPAISDTGRTVGWVSYYPSAPFPITGCFATAGTFGSWTSHVQCDGEQFHSTWNSIVIGLQQGVAFIDNGKTNTSHVIFKYVQDGASNTTREVNLTTMVEGQITTAQGALRVGASLYVFVEGIGWRALLKTDDAGATWTKKWEGTGSWGNCNVQYTSNGSFTRQDTGQPAYVENGIGIVHSGTQLLLIAADGTLTWVAQPSGNTFHAGSIHFVGGFYYAASGNAVFRTADFSSWEQVASASQILGATGTLSRMWVQPNSTNFAFYSTLNTLTLVQTNDFVTFRRNSKPSTWPNNAQFSRFNFTGSRFVWFIVRRDTSTYYYDRALFDLETGRLYAGNYFNNYGESQMIYGYSLLPLPNGSWLHYSTCASNYCTCVITIANIYNYATNTEFKLPSSTGSFGTVGAYGNQTNWFCSTDTSNYGGYSYYVRAK